MEALRPSPRIFRFAVFEVDLKSGDLRKSGLKIRIQEQPFQVLAALLEHPGEVVSREELRQRLWPEDTFVDFDHSLNTAINKLRETLGDSADSPRFIETVPRRGYRFVAPVETVGEEIVEPVPAPTSAPGPRRWLRWLAVAAIILAVAASVAGLFFRPTTSTPGVPIPLTSYPGVETHPSFSPDGNQVAFSWNGKDQNNYDIYVKLLDAGPPHRLTTDPADDVSPVWSPDGRRIAFYRRTGDSAVVYSVSSRGGSERKLVEIVSPRRNRWGLSWSPDGEHLAFRDRETADEPFRIFLLSVESREKRKLAIAPMGPVAPHSLAFSPDGRKLAFASGTGGSGDVYVMSVDGGEPTRLTFLNHHFLEGLAWTRDGREIVFSSGDWAADTMLRRVRVSGRRLEDMTALGEGAVYPAMSPQGSRLLYAKRSLAINIWRFDAQGRTAPQKLIESTRRDTDPMYSPDGKHIVFLSDRSGTFELWRCDSNGSHPVQLTSFGGPAMGFPSWSPDGRLIAFNWIPKDKYNIYAMNAEGGKPLALTTAGGARPAWSKDGRWIYFGSGRSGTSEVWKIPAEGGSPIQVTRKGGWNPIESPDGRWLYYSKGGYFAKDGVIWRIPTEGGEETSVLENYSRAGHGNWVPVEDGLYFFDWEGDRGSVKFLDVDTGRVTNVVPAEVPLRESAVGRLAISPDRRWLLIDQKDQINEDLMLVENFR